MELHEVTDLELYRCKSLPTNVEYTSNLKSSVKLKNILYDAHNQCIARALDKREYLVIIRDKIFLVLH